jgi:flagellar FliL protein
MKLLLPVLLAVLGLGAGAGGGMFLKPPPEPHADASPCGDTSENTSSVAYESSELKEDIPFEREYVKLNNQFIVPIIAEGKVIALVVLSLSIEVLPTTREEVYSREPKLRDAFLQVLFDHANSGGFTGNFTSGLNMRNLREGLVEVAQKNLGSRATDVLVTDITRQET